MRISLRANVVRTEPEQDAPRTGVSPYRVRYEFADLRTHDATAEPHAESDRAARPAVAVLAERDADGTWRTRAAPELRAARQALGPHLDGRELILEWRAERWSLRLDEFVLAWGMPDGRGLVACLDESARSGRPEGRGVAESPLATWAILEPSGNSTPSPRTDPRQDSVQLVDGDELFGELASVTAEGVDLVAAGTRLRIDWTRIRALRPARRIVASRTLRGTWANIDVGAEPIAPTSPRALLEGVVERGADGAWLLEHPWLGRVPLSRAAIERRSTGFVGTRIVLVDHAVHLGARRRDDFRCALPFGTDAAGEFELGALPPGRVRLVLHVADVAPSGPAAPPGTPDLADLRTGFGMTRLLVNGGESGDANSQLRFERSPFGPQRIVLPIDAKLLRTGRNAWSLHQTPGRTARDAFDDCEIGPVVLEFVEFESPESK